MDAGIVVGAIVVLMVLVTLAFVIAGVARKKGYSYAGFWFFGFFLCLPALIVVLTVPDKSGGHPPADLGSQCPRG